MKVITDYIELQTKGFSDIIDITHQVGERLKSSELTEGTVNIFSVGSTGGLTTVEYEPGLVKDLRALFDKLAPENGRYYHEETWHDGNGFSHVRSSLLKTALSVPFVEQELILGTWQQIVFIDFDNRHRKRKIVTQFMGQ